MKNSPSMLRQIWLETATHELRPYFKTCGYEVPELVRVSIGWPKGSRGGKGHSIGQCWALEASTDKHAEIFVSPSLGNRNQSARILDVLAHELCHAVAGQKAGHKGPFKQVALAIGLEGKMTATTAGEQFKTWARAFIEKHGEYPAGSINDAKIPKQSTRLIKAECSTCGYVARVTRKWIDEAGAPYCGSRSHGRMGTDYETGEDDD